MVICHAANEVAVESFLTGRMPFTAIPIMIEHVMGIMSPAEINTLDDVLAADNAARLAAQEWLLCKV